MPRVPTAQSAGLGQVSSTSGSPLPSVRQSIQTSEDNFGGYQARVMGRVAQSLGNAAEQQVNVEVQNATLEAANLENQAQREVMDYFYNPQSGLLNTRGAQAINAPDDFQVKIDDVRKKYGSQSKNPLTQQLLGKSIDRLSLTGRETALRHASTQRLAYASDLAGARVGTAQENAALNYNDEDLFQDSIDDVRRATHAQALLDGLKEGDEVYNQKMRNAVSGTYTARIDSMISTGDPGNIVRAAQLLEQGYKDGNINLKSAQSTRTTLKTLLPKAAATIELGKMGTYVSNPTSAIDFVINDLEGGDQVVPDGEGISKYGINSAANPDIDVENLTEEEAATLYKERYWDKNKINELPEKIRLAAFDTYVNGFDPRVLGFGAAEAIEKANGDPDALLETRLQYYKTLAEKNPEKRENLEGWYNRVKKVSAASRKGNYDIYEVGDRAAEMSPDVGEEMLKQAKEHNDLVRYSSIGINKSILNLLDDPKTPVQDKMSAINRAEVNGKITDAFAADARRYLNGPKIDIPEEEKLAAYQSLDEQARNLRVQFGGTSAKIKSSQVKITSENLDAYTDFQRSVTNALANREITEAEAKGFLKDWIASINLAIENDQSEGGSLAPGIQEPYSEAFDGIDAYLKKEGEENNIALKKELVFRFRQNLGSFNEKGEYVSDGQYKSTGDHGADMKVISKALDRAIESVKIDATPILKTLSGVPNATIRDGRKNTVRSGASDLTPGRSVKAPVKYTDKSIPADDARFENTPYGDIRGKVLRTYADGTREVIE